MISSEKNTAGVDARVLVLTGDETIGKDRLRQQAVAAITERHGTVTMERFDSSAEELAGFLERYMTPSLFQETRIFQISHAQSLDENELEELEKTIGYDIPDAYLIIDSDEERKGKEESRVAKRLKLKKKDRCAHHDLVKPPDYKLAQWLSSQVPLLFGRALSKNDAELLIDYAGNDPAALYSELQKIDIHLPPKAPVNRKIIEEVSGAARVMSPFELSRALGARNFTRALQVLDSLFATTFAAPLFVSAVFRHFWALLRIRKFADRAPQVVSQFMKFKGGYANDAQNEAAFAIGKAAGLLTDGEQKKVYPVIIASGIVEQAMNFPEKELQAIFGWLLEFDTGVKTGLVEPDRDAVGLLCFKIARSSELVQV